MAHPAAERPPARSAVERRALGVALGVAIALALAYVDWRLGARDILITTVVLAPLACALFATARDAALVGALATALVALSGSWNENFAEGTYFLRIVVVALGALVAVLASARGETIERDRARFALLAAIADVADGTLALEETAARVDALVVPAVADLCVIDVARRGELRRLAVRVRGRRSPEFEAALRERPAPPDALDGAAPELVERVDEPSLRRLARDPDELALLRALRLRSRIVVPLAARGRVLGVLTVGVTAESGRSYGAGDLEFVTVLAGRVALALDNAGLFSELETIEAQLGAAMSSLAEAVTIQRAEGALIYANDAAARMLGFPSAQALLAAPVAAVIERFETFHEDGSPVTTADLPGRKVLAGEDAEPLVLRAVNRSTREERWRVVKATPVRDRRGQVNLVVNVIEDITEVKRAELAQRLLARAGEVLGSSLDREDMLQRVAELAVPQLADWCAVALPDGRGFIRTVAVAHVDPEQVAAARRVAEAHPTPVDAPYGAAEVMRTSASQLANDITPEMLEAAAEDPEHARALIALGMRAGLVVPILAGGRAIGALSLVSAESGRRFEAADVELAEELARRAGTAIEHARLYAERTHIATALQTGLLPDALPAMPGWRAGTLYRPTGAENWVGGDFYDVVAVPGGWLVLVGDVAGHGAEAAALTALARYTLRSTARLLPDPLDAVAQLNRELAARRRMSLCTLAAVLLSEGEDGGAVAEVVCAGHPPPLLVADGGVLPVGRFGPMLGAYEDERWERASLALEPGALLVLYTDGVLDTVGDGGRRFGEPRLHRTVAGATDAREVIERIDGALRRFEVGEQADDTAVLAVQRLGAPEPAVGGGRPVAARARAG